MLQPAAHMLRIALACSQVNGNKHDNSNNERFVLVPPSVRGCPVFASAILLSLLLLTRVFQNPWSA